MASYLRMKDRKPKDIHKKKKSKEYDFNFDIEKIEKCIDSPSISIPKGLCVEDMRSFIENKA